MLSIPTRAVMCIFGFALSGCMQSVPTAETVTRPTMEAFTRLTAWSPWHATPEQASPVVVAAQEAPPVASPVAEPPAPAAAPEFRPASKPAFHMPQLASTRSQTVAPAPVAPAAEAVPAVTTATPAAAAAPVLRPKPKPAAHVPQLASTRSRPVTPAPAVPAAKVIPAVATVPAAEASAPSGLPARVTCQTASQPGERVRMECKPVE